MQESTDENKDHPLYQFDQHADHLNAINQPAEQEDVFYEIMSGALVWRDETNENTPIELIWALRFIAAYRTSLMLDQPRTELRPLWDHALARFPEWVGFRPERRKPTPFLLEIYRRGKVKTRKCIRDLERETDAEENDA